MLGDDLDGSDGDGTPSEDSEDEEHRGSQIRKSRPRQQQEADMQVDELPPPPKKKKVTVQEPPTALLKRLQPRVEGFDLLDTARVVFDAAKVPLYRAAVQCRVLLLAPRPMELLRCSWLVA